MWGKGRGGGEGGYYWRGSCKCGAKAGEGGGLLLEREL